MSNTKHRHTKQRVELRLTDKHMPGTGLIINVGPRGVGGGVQLSKAESEKVAKWMDQTAPAQKS